MIPSVGGDPVAIPQINLSVMGYGPNSLRDAHVGTSAMGTQEISILSQLDGPVSIPVRGPTGGRVSEGTRFAELGYSQGGTYIQGASISHRREYPDESSEDNNANRRPYRDQRPPERGRYPAQSGRPPKQRDKDGRPPGRGGYPERGRYPGGGPPDGGGPLMMEDPLMMDPLMEMEGPLTEMEDPLDLPVDKDHQALKDPLGK